jgi:hypothetical protein
MRVAILSEKEREMIKAYLSEGIKRAGFRTLLFRIRHNYEALKSDMDLIERMLMHKTLTESIGRARKRKRRF